LAQPIRFRSTVTHLIRHTQDVATIELASQRRLPRFSPGQFVHLTLEAHDPSTHWPESRVFSVANAVADRRTVRLTISRQGHYTSRILNEVEVGRELWAKGPYGDFTIRDARDHRAVLVAAGTGITPFCAYMDDLLVVDKEPAGYVHLFYAARTEGLLVYRKLAEACECRFERFNLTLIAENEVSSEGIVVGRMDIDWIVGQISSGAPPPTFYLSGPSDMLRSFEGRLVELGVDDPQIVIDAWE
jgi:ferredoxin-NADP reductase